MARVPVCIKGRVRSHVIEVKRSEEVSGGSHDTVTKTQMASD